MKKKQKRRKNEVDGLATFAELSVPLAARLAELLGLPGPQPDATDKARSWILKISTILKTDN